MVHCPVVIDGVWHRAQPICAKSCAPCWVEGELCPGVGWSSISINMLKRITSLGSAVPVEVEVGCVLGRGVELAAWRLIALGGEHLVGDADLHVVGLAGKYLQRFVLRLPAKTSDSAVIAAGVRLSANAQLTFLLLIAAHVGEDGSVGDLLIRPPPKTGVGMRKIRSPSCAASAKLGCEMLQPGASMRPVMVNRSCTPPST